MQDEEQSISDATLIARLRAANAYKGPDFNTPIADPIKVSAADRIEQLVATNEALVRREEKLGVLLSAAGSVADAMKARAEAAEARADAMRQAVQHATDHADAAIADMETMRAERDALKEHVARAEAVEARAERLEAALRGIVDHDLFHDHQYLSADLVAKLEAARAALTQKEPTDG